MMMDQIKQATTPLKHVSLETGTIVALVGLAFFVGMIVQKIWSYGVVACWWPV